MTNAIINGLQAGKHRAVRYRSLMTIQIRQMQQVHHQASQYLNEDTLQGFARGSAGDLDHQSCYFKHLGNGTICLVEKHTCEVVMRFCADVSMLMSAPLTPLLT